MSFHPLRLLDHFNTYFSKKSILKICRKNTVSNQVLLNGQQMGSDIFSLQDIGVSPMFGDVHPTNNYLPKSLLNVSEN